MLRSLSHFWRRHLAVVLAAAVTGAVLTGALVVGGSVRESLRALLLDRLGRIELVTVVPRFFRAGLAPEVARRAGGGPVVPLILLRGSATRAGKDSAATRVQVLGIDERFAVLYPRPEPGLRALAAGRGGIFPPLVVNETLAKALGVAPGDDVLLHAEQPSAVPRETLMGYKDPDSVVANLRLTVLRVIPDRAAGSFDLALGQGTPANAFVPLAELARALGQEGRANTLLFAGPRPGGADAAAVETALHASLDLEDLGLTLRPVPAGAPGALVLDSRDFFLPPAVAQAAAEAAGELRAPLQRVFTYLAIGLSAHGREVPYSLISALDPLPPAPGETLQPVAGTTALGDGEVLLDSWAAEDLAVRPGDPVEVRYFLPASGSAGPVLHTAAATLRVQGVVALAGLAVDRTLTPAVAGIAEARDIASWSAPFPVDLHRVRPRDEDYWHRYGPAPKAFVTLATGQRLWRGPFGDLTSLRIAVPAGSPESAAAFAQRFRARLLAHLPVAPFGFQPRAIRAEGLRAADAGTDFTSLFLGFSSFLLLAAAALAGLLFSLGLERRAAEVGLLLALGFPLRAVRRRFLGEGLALATAGALLGLAGAWAFAAVQVYALGRWWLPAVGTSRLRLALAPSTLLAGFAATVLVVLLSLISGVRRIVRVPAARLLAGSLERGGPPVRETRRLRLFAAGATLSTLLCGALLAAGRFGGQPHPALAFGLGVSLLVAGGSGFLLWCRRAGEGPSAAGGRGGLVTLALRNGTVNPRRSVLALSLVAAASFVLVMVAANRREPPAGRLPDWAGFTLLAESQVPLYQDLGSPAGRAELGFPEAAEALLAQTEIAGLREVPGDDASCLNLYLPRRPRLLGVPPPLAHRAGFRFAATAGSAGGVARPLTLLEGDGEKGEIPAIGDEQAVRWILHLGLDDELAAGAVRLRIVGLLSGSPLQGALLVSDARLARAFPGHGGRSVFLLRPPPGREEEVARALRGTLGPFGLTVTTVGARMALYREVENTYLAIFQALGGLGLMLGTLGLGVVLLASVVERRWELAALRAFGFRRRRLAALLLLENGALLVLGLALGTAAGLLAAGLGGGEQGPFPWLSLLPTLAGVVLAGLAACTLAVVRAVRSPLLAVLKAER